MSTSPTRLGLLAHAFGIAALGMAQVPSIQWQRCLGGTLADEGAWVQEMPDGTFLLTGTTNSPTGDFPATHGNKDIWVAGLSSNGEVLWQHVLGGSGDDEAHSVLKAADGTIVVAGSSTSSDGDVSGAHGDRDAWIAKLNTAGQLLWQRALGGSGRDQANALVETAEGDLVICGMTTISDGDVSGSHGLWDAWVVKVSGAGQLLWQRALGGTENDWAHSLVIGTEGKVHVSGTTSSADGDASGAQGGSDAWVLTLSDAGTLLWQLPIGTSYNQEGGGICLADGGDIFLSGNTNSDFEEPSNFIGNARYMAARITPEGDLVWKRWLPGYHYDRATSIVPVQDDLLLFGTGYSYLGTFDFEHLGYDPMAYRLSTDGDSLWSNIWGGTSAYDYGQRMIPTVDGGYLFIGSVWSNNGDVQGWLGGGDAWVVKLGDPDAGLHGTVDTPARIAPNPNNGSFVLDLPNGADGSVADLIDAQGRSVRTIPRLRSGSNSIQFAHLADGQYTLRIIRNGRSNVVPISINNR